MFREPEAPPPGIGGTEQPDAGNAKQVRSVKHAGVDPEERVTLTQYLKGINQRKPLRVNDAAVKVLEIQLRFFEIQNKSHKVAVAFEEGDKELFKKMRRPDFLRLGFIVNGQDALAGSGIQQEIPDS